ncbi:MAG: formate/nitrite transporter family protein [Firmicutes bacterium]|nr:formate/nitrite transporter family protein [Bacillota bacterium]
MKSSSGPKNLTNYILNQTQLKSSKSISVLLMQGILAGLYIAIGAIGSLKVSASVTSPGLGDFLGAVVFPVGIIAIIVMQAELYTSNCMITSAIYAGQSKAKKIFQILSLVLFANLLGSIFAAFLTVASGMFNESVIALVTEKALTKVNIPLGQLFASAIFCNIIVCTGVCLAYNSKDEIAKLITLWLAITVFVISGTEHVVANMYYLFAALFYGAPLTAKDIVYNLLVAAIGNFIGGGIIVAGINCLLASRTEVKQDSSSSLAV